MRGRGDYHMQNRGKTPTRIEGWTLKMGTTRNRIERRGERGWEGERAREKERKRESRAVLWKSVERTAYETTSCMRERLYDHHIEIVQRNGECRALSREGEVGESLGWRE